MAGDRIAHNHNNGVNSLHVVFFPYLAPGHMIPLANMARLFAGRSGVRSTIVTTSGNARRVRPVVDAAGIGMDLILVPFPSAAVGLPEGCENSADISSHDDIPKLYHAICLLREPLRRLLLEISPDCIVSDVINHWIPDLAADIGIPNLVYHSTSPFVLSISDQIELNGVTDDLINSDEEVDKPFVVPGNLPHLIEITRSELPSTLFNQSFLAALRDAENKSFGAVINCFYEMSPEYVELCKLGGARMLWCLGPVFQHRNSVAASGVGVGESEISIATWLDSKQPESVLYVCFGSEHKLSDNQLRDLAAALESIPCNFILVVKGGGDWPSERFKEKNKNKGFIIDGWAPQLFILNHPAIGAFLTHCGYNSILEAVAAGVPMATFPLIYDQFLGERLVADVLRIGVRARPPETTTEAVTRLMDGGEEAVAVRKRARELSAMAKTAMDEGGSSYSNLTSLIEELRAIAQKKRTL